jgi:hypothetical protein
MYNIEKNKMLALLFLHEGWILFFSLSLGYVNHQQLSSSHCHYEVIWNNKNEVCQTSCVSKYLSDSIFHEDN